MIELRNSAGHREVRATAPCPRHPQTIALLPHGDRLQIGRIDFRDTVTSADPIAVKRLVEATAFFTPAEADIAVELVQEFLQRGVASGYQFLFADRGQTVVGYACFGPIACTMASYDLYWIVVDPCCQRSGLGSGLMTGVEDRIREMRGQRIYVDTSGRAQYAPTRAFYERCGYRQAALLEDFYAAGDDKVIYVKVLQINTKPS
jgi:ribosomal protein S18 acetylase RimI-like enzyme